MSPGLDETFSGSGPPGRRAPAFDLRLLESFSALADELHFGRAAERLGFAQPALSRQIARLETQIGVQLFARNAHGVVLTAAGTAFREPAAAALTHARNAAESAVQIARGLEGRLQLAIGQGILVLLTELLREFARDHPHVQVDITSITDAAGLESVRASALDAAVVWSDDTPPSPDSSVAVRDVPIGVRLLATHPLAGADPVPIEALRDQRLIIFPRHAGPAQFDRIVASYGGVSRAGGVHEVLLLGAARGEMMRALDDHSFTVGPLDLEDEDGGSGVVSRRVLPERDRAHLWLVWDGAPRAVLQAFIAAVERGAVDEAQATT